jgi:hypothetical protein
MNRLARIALVVASLITSATFAQDSEPFSNDQRVALRVDGNGARPRNGANPLALDSYAGRYDVTNGIAFLVVHEDEMLTIELPETFGLPQLRLRSKGAHEFIAVEAPVRVAFETDIAGNVSGLVLYAPNGQEPIAAARTPFRHGTVTVHDLYVDAGVFKIAASD